MESFDRISALLDYIGNLPSGSDREIYSKIVKDHDDEISLLKMLEKTTPSDQRYHLFRHMIFITFVKKKSWFDLGGISLNIRVTFIGFPMSISKCGYLRQKERNTSDLKDTIMAFAKTLKGTVVVLNATEDIHKGHLTESVFVFEHDFRSFEEYIRSTRSSYHRKIIQSLKNGSDLIIRQIEPFEFSEEHYDLYLSVHERMKQKLITMPIDYFRTCDAVIFEVRDKSQLLAFVQLKEISGILYFILGGFRKNEEEYPVRPSISHIDLYYNMLLLVIRYGIEHHHRRIVLGQTAAESKSKLGAHEELSFLYVTSSNPLVRSFLNLFPHLYAFSPYGVQHKVFKDKDKDKNKDEADLPQETMA